MTLPVLGIDIAKAKFDVALLIHGKFKTKVFKNTAEGFATLSTWLSQHGIDRVHACMEATGRYGEALATCLAEAGHIVSVVNPAQIKGYAQSELTRTKTDQADAKLIARFCQTLCPAPWQPAPAAIRTLQGLVRRLQALLDMRLQETNRLDVAYEPVTASINTVLVTLNQEIDAVRRSIRDHIDQHPLLRKQRELLASIPGIGEATIAQILAFIGNPANFQKAKQLAAFIGVNPRQHSSGSSIRGRTRLSKTGNPNLRKALYMPAIVAMRYNPTVRAFCQRLRQAGKPKMAIVGAAMRKLVHIIYGVLKSGTPFNPKLTPLPA
jgi:transposase